MAAEWVNRCKTEWSLWSVPLDCDVDWKCVYEAKPFRRNLLKNPSPYGLSPQLPPPSEQSLAVPAHPEGDLTDWTTSADYPPRPDLGESKYVCYMPTHCWINMEQTVDLLSEGLWAELLDHFQPDIVIQDWYEWTPLGESIYELRVELLGADRHKVLSEFTTRPKEDDSTYLHIWKEVSHVFSNYGPGVRYVRFLHRLKNDFMIRNCKTHFTESSVIVRPTNGGNVEAPRKCY